jgi:hypothetical protein
MALELQEILFENQNIIDNYILAREVSDTPPTKQEIHFKYTHDSIIYLQKHLARLTINKPESDECENIKACLLSMSVLLNVYTITNTDLEKDILYLEALIKDTKTINDYARTHSTNKINVLLTENDSLKIQNRELQYNNIELQNKNKELQSKQDVLDDF